MHILNIQRITSFKNKKGYEVNLTMLKGIFIAIFLCILLLFQYILAIILVKRSKDIIQLVQGIQEKVDKPVILEESNDEDEILSEESVGKEVPIDDQEIIFEKKLKLDDNVKEIEINIEADSK